MSTSPVFEWLCTAIGERSGLDALKSRGTLRLALQGVGLEARTLTKPEADVVIAKVLPQELKLRGFGDADVLCRHMGVALKLMTFREAAPESAESAFARFAGDRSKYQNNV